MTLTHRRHCAQLSQGYVVLFADSDRNSHYGQHVWTLETELGTVPDEIVWFAAEYYDVDFAEAESLVKPEDIVSSAGAWDDEQFVSDLWLAMEYNKVPESPGYRTPDGAVVLDRESVEMVYSVDR